jgi:hypothetical protein
VANKAVHLPVIPSGFGGTLRRDNWWLGPMMTVIVFSGFIVYATYRAFEGTAYEWGAYLSPFYSPFIGTDWAKGTPLAFLTPAMLILPGPGSFRFTCYYYRKAYYRSFVADPPGCAVGEPAARKNYKGEKQLLLFQNLHRFTLYVAILFLVILWKDAVEGFIGWKDGFHVGVGSLVMVANCVLLSGYTFGCHAFRHLVGGNVNSYSTATGGALRFKTWKLVSGLNANHQLFAWMSLFSVALTDVYIRCVATGCITDVRIF